MAKGGRVDGDQPGNGLFASPAGSSGPSNDRAVRSFIPEVSPDEANIEAERGETVWGPFSGDGIAEHFQIGGERHAQGGTPLHVPDGSFIFSDTKKLKIGGPVLQEFGKGDKNKKKYTPAQLAKQYNVNYYKQILSNPDTDYMQQKTAQLMLQNYQQKLAKLALLQEGMKGFPQGIPGMAMPLVQQMAANQQQANPGPGMGNMPMDGADMPQQLPMAQKGGTKSGNRSNATVTLDDLKQQFPVNALLNTFVFPGVGDLYDKAAGYAKQWIAPPRPAAAKRTGPRTGPDDGRTRPLYSNNFAPVTDEDVVYPGYLPDDLKANVPWVQHKRNDGLYGNQSWDMNDFYQRHPWVQQARPNFNPSNPNDVNWFQNEYNDRYRDKWGFNYFNGEGHRKIDSKFGQGTYSTPSLEQEDRLKPSTYKVPLVPIGERGTIDAKVVSQTLPQASNTALNWKNPGDDKNRWWAQDKINFGAALANRYNLRKYMPTFVGTNAVLPNPTFFDPTRQLAANQEAANSQNMMSAFYAGPQRFRAVGSNIQGQGATNAANILAQVQNQNVGVANQFEAMRNQVLNNQGLQNAVARKTYLDELATVNQQFDNSKAMANQNLLANLQSGITNAEKTGWINKMNPYYSINPSNGQLFFKQGKGLNAASTGSSAAADPISLYNTYMEQYMSRVPGADRKSAQDFATRMAFANKSQFGVDSDGDSRINMSGIGNNAAMMAYLNNYMPQFAGMGGY